MASNQNVNKVVYGNTALIDLTGDDVTAGDVLSGKRFHLPSGAQATGTIASQAAQTITPGTSDQTIAAGKYLSGAQTIKGDANLVAGNIKSGVSIFGVAGSCAGALPKLKFSPLKTGSGTPSVSNCRIFYPGFSIKHDSADIPVFAGTLNLETRVLTVTHGYAETNPDGSLQVLFPQASTNQWVGASSVDYVHAQIGPAQYAAYPSASGLAALCNLFTEEQATVATAEGTFTIRVNSTGNINRITLAKASIPDASSITDAAGLANAAKQYFADLYAQGKKMQLSFRLKSPLTYTLTQAEINDLIV